MSELAEISGKSFSFRFSFTEYSSFFEVSVSTKNRHVNTITVNAVTFEKTVFISITYNLISTVSEEPFCDIRAVQIIRSTIRITGDITEITFFNFEFPERVIMFLKRLVDA